MPPIRRRHTGIPISLLAHPKMSFSFSIRDQLISNWNDTQQFHTKNDVKRVYYMSLEFLLGRSLDSALLNMGVKSLYKSMHKAMVHNLINLSEALMQLGFNIDELIQEEVDAALGNGGLGMPSWFVCAMIADAVYRPPRCVLHGLAGDHGSAGLGLRDPLHIRNLPAADHRWLPDRVPGLLAHVR